MIGGTQSGRPAIAAAHTAIMAPEISPPGSCALRNSPPPAAARASVSSALKTLVRLKMAGAVDAGIRLTPALSQIPAADTNTRKPLQQCARLCAVTKYVVIKRRLPLLSRGGDV